MVAMATEGDEDEEQNRVSQPTTKPPPPPPHSVSLPFLMMVGDFRCDFHLFSSASASDTIPPTPTVTTCQRLKWSR